MPKFISDVQLVGSSTDLTLQDGGIIKLGTDVDFQIQHNGSNGFLQNYTGAFYIDQNKDNGDIIFRSDDGSGGVTPYIRIDGSDEITRIYKDFRYLDDVKAKFGSSGDLQIYHDGSNSYINESGTGSLITQASDYFLRVGGTNNTNNAIVAANGGTLTLYYANSAKLATTNTGIDVTGTANIDNLTINGAQGTDGQVLTSTGSGVAWEDAGGSSDTAERIEVAVKNVHGATLAKGTVVHAEPTGTLSGNVIEVVAADANTKMPAIGILNEALLDDGEGKAVMFGTVQGIDTSGFSVGDELYVSATAGAFTATKPTATNEEVQKIAIVIKSHASNGLIKVFGAGRSNDVPNLLTRNISIDGADFHFGNADQVRMGGTLSSPGLRIQHNGSHSYIDGEIGNMYFRAEANDSDISFQADDGSGGNATYLTLDGGDERIYVNRLMRFADDVQLRLGDNNDIRLYHNSTTGNNNFENHTGGLFVTQYTDDGNIIFRSDDGSGGVAEYLVIDGGSGAVKLKHYGNTKFETTSTGVSVTGGITSGSITSSGASSGRYTGLEVVNTTNAGGTETAIGLGVVSAGNNSCDVKLVANRVGANSGSDFYIEQTNSSGTQTETFRITENGNATFAGDVTVNGGDLTIAKQNDAPTMTLLHDGTNPSTSDLLFKMQFQSDYDGGHQNWGKIQLTTNASSVRTNLDFYVKSTGGNEELGLRIEGGSTTPKTYIYGDLIVEGDTTTLNTQTVEVEDNILQLNTTQGSPDTATATTSGISIYRGSGVTQASFIFDDADDTWDLTNNLQVSGNVLVTNGGTLTSNNYMSVEGASSGAYIRFKHGTGDLNYVGSSESLTGGFGDENDMLNYTNGKWGVYTSSTLALTIDESQNATFAGNVTASSSTGHFSLVNASAYQLNGTYVMDSSRNLVNIAAITASGDIVAPGIYVGSANTSFDFYNNGTTYLNGTTTIDAACTITSGTSVGLTINHDTFEKGLVLHRNHASNASSIVFRNNSGLQGTLLAISNDNHPYWQVGSGTDNYRIWHEGNDDDLFKKGADIGGSQNLNNYTTPGFYHQNSNSSASSGTNYPANVAGMLTVTSDGVMVYQIYQGYGANHTYERKYYNGTWQSWHLIYDSGVFTNNSSNWNVAFNDKINSASFNTSNGVLTLTQQDGGTVTVDLDGRYSTGEADTLATVTGRGAATSSAITITNDTYGIFLRTATNGAGSAIRFSDQQPTANQTGDLRFYHSDSGSVGSGASFHFQSTESQLSIVAGDADTTGKFYSYPQADAGEVDFGWANDTDTGMYRPAANQLGLVAGASRKLLVSSSGVQVQNGTLYVTSGGSAASPAIQVGDTDSGFYDSGANQIGFSGGGSVSATLDTTRLAVTGYVSASAFRPTNIVTNRIVKFDGTDLDDSLLSDDGSTLTYNGAQVIDAVNSGIRIGEDVLFEITEADTTETIRKKLNDRTSTSINRVDDATAPAGGCFEFANRYENITLPALYKVDDGVEYTFEVWVKFVSGSDTDQRLYAGASFYNSGKTYLGNTQRYWGESGEQIDANSRSDGSWYHFSGTLGPDRGTATGDIPNSAEWMKLILLLNYSSQANTVRFCGLKFYKSGGKQTRMITSLYRKSLGSQAGNADTWLGKVVMNNAGNLYTPQYLYHYGDTNTNLNFGADALNLQTGGTDRVKITNSKVEIDNSCHLKLGDSGDITDPGFLRIRHANSGDGELISLVRSAVRTWRHSINSSGDYVIRNVDGTYNLLTMSANSNLGIGINPGNYKLQTGTGNIRFKHQHNGTARLELFQNRQDASNVKVWEIAAYNSVEVANIQFYRGGGGSTGYTVFQAKGNNAMALQDIAKFGLNTSSTSEMAATFYNGIYINDTNTRLHEGDGNALRIQTGTGIIDIGSMNSSWVHMQANKNIYMYPSSKISVDGNLEPYTHNTRNLGSDTNHWATTFTHHVETDNTQNRHKLSVWNGSTYTIGMKSGYTFGGLGAAGAEYAMSFQMSNTAARGFWWGDTAHTDAQGAFAVTTTGRATLAHSLRIGYGETDTTQPGNVGRLDVNGTLHMNGSILMSNFDITEVNRIVINDPGPTEGIAWSGGNGWQITECPDNMSTNSSGNLQFATGYGGTLTRRVTMTTGGALNATGDVIAYSDRRVKENIETIDNALDKVSKLRGVSYNRNDVEDKSKKIGVIAQEVKEILPEVVHHSEDIDVYSVAYGNMAGLFIEAIKELKQEIEELKKQIK